MVTLGEVMKLSGAGVSRDQSQQKRPNTNLARAARGSACTGARCQARGSSPCGSLCPAQTGLWGARYSQRAPHKASAHSCPLFGAAERKPHPCVLQETSVPGELPCSVRSPTGWGMALGACNGVSGQCPPAATAHPTGSPQLPTGTRTHRGHTATTTPGSFKLLSPLFSSRMCKQRRSQWWCS